MEVEFVPSYYFPRMATTVVLEDVSCSLESSLYAVMGFVAAKSLVVLDAVGRSRGCGLI